MNPILYRNRRTLFLREVNSGKTTRTREILLAFLREGEEGIALFDFAPEKFGEVGGKIFLARLERVPTAVMNGSYGGYFGESPLSRREREQMDLLKAACHQVSYLSSR